MASTHLVRARLAVVALVFVGSAGLLACSDDDGADVRADEESGGSASETASGSEVAPEELRASDEDVAAGLGELVDLIAGIADQVGTDDEAAATDMDGVEAIWQPIEGTILENDEDTYITFEDNFAVLGNAVENSDAALADDANTAISEAADAYLAEHPG